MPVPRKVFNPFYPLVVVVGTAFVLTACAFWVQTLSAAGRLPARSATVDAGLGVAGGAAMAPRSWMDRWGVLALEIELAVLICAAVMAMGLDRWRSRRDERRTTAGPFPS